MTAPLSGVLVADFSRVLAGPLAAATLADLGATVIKVERPELGDDTRQWGPPWTDNSSSYFECANRNKRSVELDLTDEADRLLAIELATRADVLIENFRDGTLSRKGLGYEDIARVNPGIVYASVTGFGSHGGKDLPGYDFLVQAVGGLMSITGPPGQPTRVGVALIDVLTAKDAVIGVLAALRARELTRAGQRIEVNLLSSLLGSLANQASSFLATGKPPQSMANRHPSIAPYETLEARDGQIAVCCGNDSQFAKLTQALGIPHVADDPRFTANSGRVKHRDELRVVLESALAHDTADAWTKVLTDVGVPAGTVKTIAEAFDLAEQLGLQPLVDVGPDAPAQVRNPVTFSAHPHHRVRTATATRAAQPRRPPVAHRGEAPMTSSTTLPPFEPLDPAGIDDLLSADEKAVRASVRQLCAERIDPYVADWFERGQIDDVRGLAKELGTLGVLGMHLEGYGCAGMSATEYGLACLELEATDSGIRSLVSVQGSLAMFALWRWGSEEHKTDGSRHGRRGGDRLLRSHRARLRVRPREHAHSRPQGRL